MRTPKLIAELRFSRAVESVLILMSRSSTYTSSATPLLARSRNLLLININSKWSFHRDISITPLTLFLLLFQSKAFVQQGSSFQTHYKGSRTRPITHEQQQRSRESRVLELSSPRVRHASPRPPRQALPPQSSHRSPTSLLAARMDSIRSSPPHSARAGSPKLTVFDDDDVKGGTTANIVLLRNVFVVKEGWLDDRTFNDLLALGNALPGPAFSQVSLLVHRLRIGGLCSP